MKSSRYDHLLVRPNQSSYENVIRRFRRVLLLAEVVLPTPLSFYPHTVIRLLGDPQQTSILFVRMRAAT